MNEQAPVIVFGEGSASVFIIQELLKRNEKVFWMSGSGSRLLPVAPHVKSALAATTLIEAKATLAGQETSDLSLDPKAGHRVFRNKAFKPPVWKRYSDPSLRLQNFENETWTPEQAWLGTEEVSLCGLHPVTIEEDLRASYENDPRITRVGNIPIVEFEVGERGGKIQLANGLLTEFKQFFYCDELSGLKSLPKLLTVFKHQTGSVKASDRFSAIQVVFHHAQPLKQEFQSGLVIPMNRESGESFDRNVLGGFITPNRSVWTVFLEPAECEDNHEIMKKLRKLKQALNRAFDHPEYLPEGKSDFMATVEKEQVRFENGSLLPGADLREETRNPDFILLNDSLGFSVTLERIARLFQYECVDLEAYAASEVPGMNESELDLSGIELPPHLIETPVEINPATPA
jgi:hypothetical protein